MQLNQSITNQKIYFFTYKDIVLIYKKYPDLIYDIRLFPRLFSNSYYDFHIGSKTYRINPRNPIHFITDVTNHKEETEFNKKMVEVHEFLKRTNYPHSRNFTLSTPEGYDNKKFIHKKFFLKEYLEYDKFLKVYEVVPDIYNSYFFFSNQVETYIKVYNLVFIVDPLNKDELIIKTSITSFNLPMSESNQNDY